VMLSYLDIAKKALEQHKAQLQGAKPESKKDEFNEINEDASVSLEHDAREAELQEISDRIEHEGYLLLWSNVLEDFVAFYMTEADRQDIPAFYVPYSNSELQALFSEESSDWSLEELRRIYMAKKIAGFVVTEVHNESPNEL